MSHEMNLSFLEIPEILEAVFPLVYSPFSQGGYLQSNPAGAKIQPVQVDKGINIYCGFWVQSQYSPSILYFHGNGETVASHEWIAPLYNRLGINLFVAEYRGYGASGGQPTVKNMLNDAHVILTSFQEVIKSEGFKGSIFLMGRSLGSLPAVELAFHRQDEINGLIIESGWASNLRRLWNFLGDTEKRLFLAEDSVFLNKVKMRQISKPTLIIHGESDQLVPATEGYELYQNSGAKDKELLIIPAADHNDIMIVDQNLYFNTIDKFVRTYG
ncbi:alpha/beta hydrolase [Chloroflexota bacterium]